MKTILFFLLLFSLASCTKDLYPADKPLIYSTGKIGIGKWPSVVTELHIYSRSGDTSRFVGIGFYKCPKVKLQIP